MRILAGTCVRQEPSVLAAHLRTLLWQDAEAEIDLFYIDDHEEGSDGEECRRLLVEAGARVERSERRPEGADYGVGEDTHLWAEPTFVHLGRQKQRILDAAREGSYDAVWLVDSDLLCGRETLRSLIDADKPIVSAVFWTQWMPNDAPLPQVWQQHPYGFEGAGWTTHSFLSALENRHLVRVRGLGACTLIRLDALERGAAFDPPLADLPSGGMWQGEDRHFCVRAERLHLGMYADAWPRVWHCYRPSDRAALEGVLTELEQVPQGVALPRDWVSFTVEPCEEPQLALHVEHARGKLGELRVVEEVRAALGEMRIGDSRFVRASFPASWPLEAYRGQTRTLRVRLLDAA